MPLENLEEQGLEKNPNLELAQWKFLLSLSEHKDDKTLQNRLLDAIKHDSKCNLVHACIISLIFFLHYF